MLTWYRSYRDASFETKVFIWTSVIYGGALLIGTIYPYARLDYTQ